MAADTPDSMMPAMQADRRPAIWPWLVMPLVALTAFYCLHRLPRDSAAGDQEEAPGIVVQPQAEQNTDEGGTETAAQPGR